MLDLVIVGDCTVELWCEGHFRPGVPIRAAAGGESARTCSGAAKLGMRTGFVSKLGDDLFEPFLRSELVAAGMDLSLCPTVAGINAVAFGYGPEERRRWIRYRAETAASTLRFADLDPAYFKETTVLHSSGLFQALSPSTRAALSSTFALAASSGVHTVFSGCFDTRIWPVETARAALRELLPALEILLLDVRHSRSWPGSTDPLEIARWGIHEGARCVVVRGGPAVTVATADSVHGFDAESKTGNAGFDAMFLSGIRDSGDAVAAARQAARQLPARVEEDPAAVAHIDGGSRGNPGVAGAGVYFERGGRPWKGLFVYLGRRTNNFAEYSALLHALEYALQHGVRRLDVVSDSELLVRQMHGTYRVKDPTLRELHARAQALIARLENFSIRHVRREQNREADALANKAQDKEQSGEETY